MVVGIGGFRDLGDPNDPRRRMGGVPQQANIAGLPSGDREIARTVGGKLVYYSPQEGLSIEAAPRGRRFDEGKRAENERAIAAEIDKMRMEEAIASNDPEVTRQYFSDLLGKGELSVDLTSRAAQYAQAAPDMGPMGALKLAAAEFGAGGTTEREYQRNVSRLIGQEMADKVADMGEIRPELALINQIENEKRGRGTTDAGVADVSVSEDRLLAALAKTDLERMKPAEQAALLFALDERGQAAYRAAQQQPAPYRETTPEENRDINAASGLNRTKGLGKGGRNAFNREAGVSGRYANTNITEPYKVPILVAPAVEEKKLGKAQNFRVDVDSKGNVIYQPARVKTGQKTRQGFDEKRYDTAGMQVAFVDPSMLLPDELGYSFFTKPDAFDSERTSEFVNVPTSEMQPYYGSERGGEMAVHGHARLEDPAAAKVSRSMTLGKAVQDIRYRHRTPLMTVRRGEGDAVMRDGQMYLARDGMNTGIPLYPLKNQRFENPDEIEVRIGSRGEITEEGMRELNDLINAVLPSSGVKNAAGEEAAYTMVVNNALDDPRANRIQNALLKEYIADELFQGGKGAGALDNRPFYSVLNALAAGNNIEGGSINATPEMMPTVNALAGNPDAELGDLLEVQDVRRRAQQAGKRASLRDINAYAAALGGGEAPAGSAEEIAFEKAMAEMTRRIQARAAEDNAASNDSPLNAPSRVTNFAKTKIEQLKQALRNRGQ
tara:strand:- start:2737 stop:4899 length:2163 start_codon:yes stop_codon:yes gene_type:complete